MHYFRFKGASLYCENIKIEGLVKKFGTPLYVYSYRTMIEHFEKIKKAFLKVEPLICYSVKANSNLSIIKALLGKGAGLDIVSGGELFRAKKVGCSPRKIVYASVGKTTQEIADAIRYKILMFNVESLPELKRINQVASALKKRVDVALRFNPDIKPDTHTYITTAKKETKFGMGRALIKKILSTKNRYRNLNIVGIHIHIGSQITQAKPFIAAIKKTLLLLGELCKKDINLKYLNIGGGLGIVYDKERPQTAKAFAVKVLPLLKETGLRIILEPGRFIVGNAGILVTKVLYVKENPKKNFIIVDAAMNDLIRPSLYGAYHKIVPLKAAKKTRGKKMADVVGPVCESGDFLGKKRALDVKEADYLVVMSTGAYGFVMASNYNSRPRTAEVLVKNKKAYLIRRRETHSDLVSKEILIK